MSWNYRMIKYFLVTFTIIGIIFLLFYFTFTIKEIIVYQNSDTFQRCFIQLVNVILLAIDGIVSIYGLYFLNSGIKAINYHLNHPVSHITSSNNSKLPKVSILIPIKDKDPIELKQTINSLETQDYPRHLIQIIISSNSTITSYKNEYKKLCKQYNACYVEVHPAEKGFKARVLNEGLKKVNGEYVIILDSDHVASPSMVKRFVESFLSIPEDQRDQIAYIQAKASFGDTKTFYRKASSILLAHFYEVFEKAKSQEGTVIFNGSTACFQTKILKKIDGFPMNTYTEDSDASIKLLIKGYKGFFLNQHLSKGKTPETFKDQVSQLWRWSHGAGSIFRLRARAILTTSSLNFTQKIDLLLSVSILFAAIGIVGIPILITLMVAFNIPILRPIIPGYGTLVLGPATIVMVGHFTTALLAIYWETRARQIHKSSFGRFMDLLAYYFLSLASFFFIVGAFFKGMLLKEEALASNAKWNRDLTTWPPYFALVILTIIAIFSTIKILSFNNNLYFPVISLFLSFPISLILVSIDMKR